MSSPRVLIVEDEAIIAFDLEMKLLRLGCQVVGQTATGEEAISLAGELRPDLILMDIQLAGALDGIAAIKAIRAQFPVPIIFMSANEEKTIRATTKHLDPFGFLSKPFAYKALEAALEAALPPESGSKTTPRA